MDAEARQRVLRQITYGLFVVTTRHNDQVAAGTINWLTQISFEPPLVVVGMKSGSGIALLAEESGRFMVNVLGMGQKEVAAAFFQPAQIEETRINGVPFHGSPDGPPILKEVPSAFECAVEEIISRGDHEIVIGRVTEVHEQQKDLPALTMASTGWFYGG